MSSSQLFPSPANASASGSISNNSAVAIKSSAGVVRGWHLDNTANAAATYFQFFDDGSPTVGSTTPKLSIAIPAGGAANIDWPNGISFNSAITIAATTTATGSTAPSSAVTYNVLYQ